MTGAPTLDPLAIARRIADAFESADVPYAIGGALAFGYWGPPRGTIDVDVDVFPPAEDLASVFDALERAGVTVDRERACSEIRERGDFRAAYAGVRVDVFVAFDEYHEAVLARRARVNLMGRPGWILSAEDTLVFKVLFDRPKDWIDIERLVALQAARLDRAYIRRWLAHWLEDGDPRFARIESVLDRGAGAA